MQECIRCRELLTERMARFDRIRKIKGGVPLLRDEIVAQGEMLFSGAFDLLFNPEKWTANSIPNFPVLSHDRKRTCFRLDVVDAPLPFAAACVRINCDRCGLNHRLVTLNAMLIVLASHLTAAGLGTGLEPRILLDLFHVLHSDTRPIEEFPFPQAVPRHEIYAGALWLAFHEFGHIVGNSLIRPEKLSGSESSRAAVAAELNADLAAFDVLRHRTVANKVMGDNFPILLCGVEIVLKTLAAISGFDGTPRLLRETKSQAILTHPSPWQRWSAIRDHAETFFKFRISNRLQYSKHRKNVLGRFDRSIDRIRIAE